MIPRRGTTVYSCTQYLKREGPLVQLYDGSTARLTRFWLFVITEDTTTEVYLSILLLRSNLSTCRGRALRCRNSTEVHHREVRGKNHRRTHQLRGKFYLGRCTVCRRRQQPRLPRIYVLIQSKGSAMAILCECHAA